MAGYLVRMLSGHLCIPKIFIWDEAQGWSRILWRDYILLTIPGTLGERVGSWDGSCRGKQYLGYYAKTAAPVIQTWISSGRRQIILCFLMSLFHVSLQFAQRQNMTMICMVLSHTNNNTVLFHIPLLRCHHGQMHHTEMRYHMCLDCLWSDQLSCFRVTSPRTT